MVRSNTATDEAKFDEDDYRAHVTDTEDDHKIRHRRAVQTRVVDGDVVHNVTESYDRDADARSLSFKGATRCPVDGHTTSVTNDGDTERYACDDDACPFAATVAYRDDDGTFAPVFYRVTVPDAGLEDPDVDLWSHVDDDADDEDVAAIANMVRTLTLDRFVGGVSDAAYVSAEYDDDMNKTADAYIDVVECARCGDTVEAPAVRKHAHFGDVCDACEDVEVWSPEDADLPDDVVDRMDSHKTFSASRIVKFLKDVAFYGDYVAHGNDDVDAFDGIKTGKQGKRGMGYGGGHPGTGLRRPNGAAHNYRHFRTTLRDLVDTGLVTRDDGNDTDVDDENAHFVITDKGRNVLSELARCRTCGDTLDVFKYQSTYKRSPSARAEKSSSLVVGCESCDHGSNASGAMVLSQSSTSHHTKIASVDDA